MPALGKALARLNYDLGLNQLGKFLEEQRKKKEENEFYNNLLNIYNRAKERQRQISEGFDVNDITYNPGKSEDEIGDYILGDIIPKETQIKIEGQKINIPSSERYSKAKNVFNEFQESMLPYILKEDLDTNRINKVNILSNLLAKEAEELKPKQPESFELGRGESRFIQYPGNLPIKVAEGEKFETEKNPFVKVGADGYLYQWDFDKKKFEKTNLKAPAKEWQFEPKEKQSKQLSQSTSKLIADILHPKEYVTDEFGNVLKFKTDKKGNFVRDDNTGKYIIDPAGKPMKISEEDRKYQKENALQNIMLQTLGSRSYEFIKNMEKLYGRRLSPQELKNEAIKHAKEGKLPDDAAGEIAEFLPYYNVIYQGIR
ncbi:MAG: hypothetical protein QXD05_00145 [Candidatus Pacearchaeota archaeon]